MRNSYAYQYNNYKAKKNYRCDGCRGIIRKGQWYQKEEGGLKYHYDPKRPEEKLCGCEADEKGIKHTILKNDTL